jgi:ABC-2 type transport system permease protein
VIRLVVSEMLRARSRRVVPMMIVGTLFGVLAGVTIGTFASDPAPSAAQIERAEQRYERQLQACLDGETYALKESGFATYEELCPAYVQPQQYLGGGLKWIDLESLLEGTATLVIMLGALLGATLGGADWSAGTMTTLLTWEPRRARVFVARAITVVVVVGVITLLAQLWLTLAIAAAVAVKGTFALTPPGFLADVALAIVRVSAVAMAIGLIGLAFATVGRSTVAAVGAFLGYLVVVEGFIAAWVFGVARMSLGRAATVAASGEPLLIFNQRPPPRATPEQLEFLLEPGRAWITLLAWVVAACAVALVSFRARDVT